MVDDPREQPCPAPQLPDQLSEPLAGYCWRRDLVGESGATVFRLSGKPQAEDLFVKRGTGPVADNILAEAERLRWLSGRIEVPAVRFCLVEEHEAWLVTSAMPGRTACQLLEATPPGGRQSSMHWRTFCNAGTRSTRWRARSPVTQPDDWRWRKRGLRRVWSTKTISIPNAPDAPPLRCLKPRKDRFRACPIS